MELFYYMQKSMVLKMTEKRFVADNEYVMQDNQVWVVCGGEHSADVVATALNELIDENVELDTKCSQLEKENEELKKERNYFERKKCEYWNEYNHAHLDRINLEEENEKLKKELFEARKDYLIETADISDKLYLEDEIEEERKEIFGDDNG